MTFFEVIGFGILLNIAPYLGGILLIARSVIAVIVRDGFTPGLAEIMEPSHTNILS
jgi:hypothetical protein